MQSNLDPVLRQKYLDTDYVVSDDPPLTLRIGEPSDDARVLLASFGVSTAAFITAWNPGSVQLSDDDNDDRQAVLLGDIEARRLNYLVGYGENPTDETGWREYSYLILGIERTDATELAQKHEQFAYVWLDESGVPELVGLI